MRRHPGFEGQTSWTEANHRVEVHLKDGRVISEQADRATTGALRGVTRDDVRVKFRDCAAVALDERRGGGRWRCWTTWRTPGRRRGWRNCWGDRSSQKPGRLILYKSKRPPIVFWNTTVKGGP